MFQIPLYKIEEGLSITFNNFQEIFDELGGADSLSNYSIYTDNSELLANLFKNNIRPKYLYYFWHSYKEDTPESRNIGLNRLFYNILDFLNATVDRYKLLISGFNKSLDELIKQINTSTNTDVKGITNDTPQTNLEGELFEDKYASVANHIVTNVESNTDTMPYLEKLVNLRNQYIAVMDAWANEFDFYIDGIDAEAF